MREVTSKNEAQIMARKKINISNKVCEKCKSDKNLLRHHVDYKDPLNITILCRKCHSAWHAKNDDRQAH